MANHCGYLLQRCSLSCLDAFAHSLCHHVICEEIQCAKLIIWSPSSPGIAMRAILVKRERCKFERLWLVRWRLRQHTVSWQVKSNAGGDSYARMFEPSSLPETTLQAELTTSDRISDRIVSLNGHYYRQSPIHQAALRRHHSSGRTSVLPQTVLRNASPQWLHAAPKCKWRNP
jgi:hypothetical protein